VTLASIWSVHLILDQGRLDKSWGSWPLFPYSVQDVGAEDVLDDRYDLLSGRLHSC